MNPPKAVIASVGRSGSGFIYKVLQEYGINAGHEEYFCFPWNTPKQVEIDSSWLSVPHLSEYEGVVFHQIRNPLHVLTSLIEHPPAPKVLPIRKKLFKTDTGDPTRDLMAHIVWMNGEIEKHAVMSWKLEQVTSSTINMIAYLIDHEVSLEKANKARESVSKTYNSHHDSDYLSWDDIEDCKEKSQLQQQAKRYGY